MLLLALTAGALSGQHPKYTPEEVRYCSARGVLFVPDRPGVGEMRCDRYLAERPSRDSAAAATRDAIARAQAAAIEDAERLRDGLPAGSRDACRAFESDMRSYRARCTKALKAQRRALARTEPSRQWERIPTAPRNPYCRDTEAEFWKAPLGLGWYMDLPKASGGGAASIRDFFRPVEHALIVGIVEDNSWDNRMLVRDVLVILGVCSAP